MEAEKVAWAYTFKSAKRWLTAIMVDRTGSSYTERSYACALFKFCGWMQKNPDELIATRQEELKNEKTAMDTEEKLREFFAKLENEGKAKGLKGIKSSLVTKLHAPIKSFFKYNYVPLKMFTPKFATQPLQPHTMEEIKMLMQVADVRERAIVMFLKDSGTSREDAVKLTYRDIQSEYEQGKEIIHLQLTRQKEAVGYDTFLGKEAVDNLRVYLEYRKRQGETVTKETRLLATLHGKTLTPENLSMIFVRLSKKVGFDASPHRLRKFFASHLGLAAPSICVKSWLGHKLGVEGAYYLPPLEEQRLLYAEAYQKIEIFRTEVNAVDRRKQEIRDNIALLVASGAMKQEQADGINNSLKSVKKMEELEEGIRNNMRFYRSTDKTCVNGNCQKRIEESELDDYMQKGWHFIATLPSGKILVSNE